MTGKIRVLDEQEDSVVTSAKIAYVTVVDTTYHNKIRFLLCAEEDYPKYSNGIAFSFGNIESGRLSPEKHICINTQTGEHRYVAKGATVLDFAFILHKDIGLCFEHAIVNDREVPFDRILQNGDSVVIKTSPTRCAAIDWLRFVTTTRAKDCLIEYFRSHPDTL